MGALTYIKYTVSQIHSNNSRGLKHNLLFMKSNNKVKFIQMCEIFDLAQNFLRKWLIKLSSFRTIYLRRKNKIKLRDRKK